MTLTTKPHCTVLGAGFIGKAVIRNLLLKGNDVSVLDRHICPSEFSGKVTWITADYHDQNSLGKVLLDASVAYHLVSSTVPGDQHIDVTKELNENVVGSLHFVDACVAAGIKRIVFASSSSVYGIQDCLPINESAPTNPISSHGIHKLTVEKYLLLAQRLYGIEVRVLRIANPYGPEQNVLGRQGFIAIVIGNLLRGTPVSLRDNGSSVRDYIYIDDVAEALVLSGSLDGLPSVINIASGKGHSLQEVLNLMERLIGHQIATVPTESRIMDVPSSILDIELSRTAMYFVPTTGLRVGLIKTLRHHGFDISNEDVI
jgi:UDP-glucose 4-epimerase